MKLESVPISQAEGLTLAHNVTGTDGRRALRKGRELSARDLDVLRTLGQQSVYVARLETGDVAENPAAGRISRTLAGPGLRLSPPRTGRVNLYAEPLGVLRLDLERLARLNLCEGVTLSTSPRHTAVEPGQMVATLKVLPYALDEATLLRAEAAASEGPILQVTAIPQRQVELVVSGSESGRERLIEGFRSALEPRLAALGASLGAVTFVVLDEDRGEATLSQALERRLEGAPDLLLVVGDTAIMDRQDLIPRSIERAGARIECFGAPVDPGNLLLLAYRGTVPIVGAPGCARSPKRNVIDLVLHRLLAGDRLGRHDLLELAHGGLMQDVPERPFPRDWVK